MSELPFYIITGLSGAGKSHALQAFEDMGFYCVDNLPSEIVDSFLTHCAQKKNEKKGIALVLDVRADDFVADFQNILDTLEDRGTHPRILFLEASSGTLLNRYKESRRPHPLGKNRSLEKAIETERNRLQPIREEADMVIDTSEINIHQFKGLLTDLHHPDSANRFTLSLTSFGFKHGVPAHLDSLYDARFLRNPHYEPKLRGKTGRDQPVSDFLDDNETAQEYLNKIINTLELIIDEYYREGKTFLSVGIGCTGGRHRSVYLVEKIAQYFNDSDRCRTVTTHRDLTDIDLAANHTESA